jgi:hypothetical protein
MNNKKFRILLAVINVLSIITLEKYWKNGIRFVFKKKKKNQIKPHRAVPDIAAPALEFHRQDPLYNRSNKEDGLIVEDTEKIL